MFEFFRKKKEILQITKTNQSDQQSSSSILSIQEFNWHGFWSMQFFLFYLITINLIYISQIHYYLLLYD